MNPELEKAALDAEEMGCLKETDRAANAKRILDDPLFVAAFGNIRADLASAFEGSEPDEGARREDIWRSIRLLDKLYKHIAEHLETGKLASEQLGRIENKRKKLGIFERLRRVA